MAKIKLCTYNILEGAIVTVTGTPDDGYPESRLYDREISLYWKDTITEVKYFHVDQGASPLPVDFLAVAGHNFDGKNTYWQYSDDDVNWYNAVTNWTQSGNNLITKSLSSPLTHRYWRVVVSSTANPQCSEVFMSRGYEFQVDFNRQPSGFKRSNVRWQETVGGPERSVKYGNKRRVRSYDLFLDLTNLSNFNTARDYLDEDSLPFYFKDHFGDHFFCRFLNDPQEDYVNEGLTPVHLEVTEVL